MPRSFTVTPIETDVFTLNEDLSDFIARNVPKEHVQEGMVLAVTTKVVSLSEGRVVAKSEVSSKEDLVRSESDTFLGTIAYGTSLTIAKGLLIAAAGIDESNAEGDYYILYPQDPYASARKLWKSLRNKWDIQNLGVILTDSHTTPLRRGVTGIGLSFWGFDPTDDLVGKPDLFGRPFKMTQINHVDALSAAAVYAMGEGTAPQPLAIVSGASLRFCDEDLRKKLSIPLEEDLYFPLLDMALKDPPKK